MHAYTVQVEASNAAGTIWQAVAPSETVRLTEPTWTAQKVAEMAAKDQTDGSNWRVRASGRATVPTRAPRRPPRCTARRIARQDSP
jgi:hypothetical protein